MPDFAVELHLRSMPGSQPALEGNLGAYGWFLGKFDSFETLKRELSAHISKELGYVVVEVVEVIDIKSEDDLGEELVELYSNLGQYPIQYRNLHTYRTDDA